MTRGPLWGSRGLTAGVGQPKCAQRILTNLSGSVRNSDCIFVEPGWAYSAGAELAPRWNSILGRRRYEIWRRAHAQAPKKLIKSRRMGNPRRRKQRRNSVYRVAHPPDEGRMLTCKRTDGRHEIGYMGGQREDSGLEMREWLHLTNEL